MNILFVCSSNICRSPYAMFEMRRLVESSPILKNSVTVDSSAVFKKAGPIFPKAAVSLIADGFDEQTVKAHVSTDKYNAPEKFERADVIIGMSKMHRFMTPFKYRKNFMTLSEAATGETVKIPDPFLYKTQRRYDELMGVIKNYLVLYVKRLEADYQTK